MPPVPASARPLKLTINSRGKSSQPITVSLPGDATSSELFKQVAAKTRLNINRIRLTTADKKTVLVNDAKKTLTDANLHDGDALIYKDLGLQMSYRGVYLLEYFGPLFIHPLFFFYGHQILYRFLPSPYNTVGPFTHSKMQLMAYGMVMAHFLKRELETLYVHRFSKATMPVFPNLLKNVGHYWGLSGLLLAAPLYGPWYGRIMLKGTLRGTDEYLYPLVGVWLFAQASNFVTHIILRSLRPDDASTKREIPYGYGFNIITCPNYFFETVGWLTFCALTLDPFSAIFTIVGVAQMIVWAKGKHRRYKQEFGDKYPRKRWVMLPGIL